MADFVSNTQAGNFINQISPNTAGFTDPWSDVGSLAIPETIQLALRWCEYVALSNGSYRQAIDRIVSYFITDIEVSAAHSGSSIEDEEKEKYETFFRDTLGIYKTLHTIALDAQVYGNAFISVLMPFKRYLFCPKCYLEQPLAQVYKNPAYKFTWANYEFNATCPNPKCQYSGIFGHIDRKGKQEDVVIKRWNPHEMEILWDPATDNCDYIWKIPSEYRRMIREGHLYHLERANWEVVQAIKHGNHLKFEPGFVYHMKEDALAGIRNRGWGISRILTNFRQVYYVQVLHRYNEAIALDYVIPFRVITPPSQGTGGGDPVQRDPINNMNLGGFMSRVNNMLRQRRRDPAAWFTLPFPVQYQALGGEATQLAPRDLLDQGLEILLNNIGIPVEMYKGSLQLQSAPAALRLFESNWSHLVHGLNRLLGFIADKISDLLEWEPVIIKLMRVTHADDLNRQLAKLQLMMGKQVSQTTGLKSVGLNYKEETKKLMEEEEFMAEQQQKLQERMDGIGAQDQMAQPQQQGQGQPQQGGGQASGGSQQGQQPQQVDPAAQIMSQLPQKDQAITPSELMDLANNIAQQLAGMDSTQKQQTLNQIKQKNETVWSIVRSVLQSIKDKAETQGGKQILGQGQQGGQPGQSQ